MSGCGGWGGRERWWWWWCGRCTSVLSWLYLASIGCMSKPAAFVSMTREAVGGRGGAGGRRERGEGGLWKECVCLRLLACLPSSMLPRASIISIFDLRRAGLSITSSFVRVPCAPSDVCGMIE